MFEKVGCDAFDLAKRQVISVNFCYSSWKNSSLSWCWWNDVISPVLQHGPRSRWFLQE